MEALVTALIAAFIPGASPPEVSTPKVEIFAIKVSPRKQQNSCKTQLLGQVKKRAAEHKAHIAVVTSVAGTAGLGTAPAYSATKRMQQTYISALAQLVRMEKIPVMFTDIRPGFVATDILNPDKKYPMLLSLQKAGDEVMKAIRRKRRIYTFDWKFRILVFFWNLVPRCIWERLTWVKN